MTEYLIKRKCDALNREKHNICSSHQQYIVQAKNAKEAIEMVIEQDYNNGFSLSKEDLIARSLGSLHNEQGGIIQI